MSSTTIIIKAFDELNVRKTDFAQLVFGTLVMEDIAGIFMMIILSTISVSKSISGGALALQLGLLVLYLVLWLVLGIFLLPTLLNKASKLMSDETLLIVSLGICFGMVLLADALGFSSALGAFLAGSLLAGTVHAERVEHLTSGVKDLFGAVFFISVGMMLEPRRRGKVHLAHPDTDRGDHRGEAAVFLAGRAAVGTHAAAGHLLRLLAGADRRIRVHHRVAGSVAGRHRGLHLSHHHLCIGHHHADHTVLHQERRSDSAPVLKGCCRRSWCSSRSAAPTRSRASRKQDSDWAVFLRRYVKRTVFLWRADAGYRDSG